MGNVLSVFMVLQTPICDVMFDRMIDAPEIASLLEDAKCPLSDTYVDGVHFNEVGILAMYPHLKVLVEKFQLDLVTSDSCLCGVFTTFLKNGWLEALDADWYGDRILQPLFEVPVRPAWGKAFSKNGFWNHLKRICIPDGTYKRVGIFCAGNDISSKNYAEKVQWQMDEIKAWYGKRGVLVDRGTSIIIDSKIHQGVYQFLDRFRSKTGVQ
jgi:hypothetical protein